MPTLALCARFVRQAACDPGRKKVDYFDAAQRGFMLEVRCSGGKTFYQRYTDERGRERQYKIGSAGVLNLDQARRKGRQIVAEALLGADPQTKRREMRAVPQLKDFVHERYLPYVRTYKTSWQTDETVLRIHILPRFGALALDEVKTEAIADLINRMREDGYASGTMNRVIVIMRYMYNLARKWKLPGVTENPAAGLSAGPDVQRNRFLSEEETEALVRSLHVDENQTAARAIILLLLTGGRRNEITQAKWDYVDWKNKTLLVPKSKSGRARVIALNQSAIALLTAMPRLDGNDYHLPVAGQRPAIGLALVSLGPYPQAGRSRRRAPARPAAFLCQLPGQPRRLALRGARPARSSARAHHPALRAPHAGNAERRRRSDPGYRRDPRRHVAPRPAPIHSPHAPRSHAGSHATIPHARTFTEN